MILTVSFISKSPPRLQLPLYRVAQHSVFSWYKIHLLSFGSSHQVSLSSYGLKEGQISGLCSLLTAHPSLLLPLLGPAQRAFPRILRDLRGIPQKVSCMLLVSWQKPFKDLQQHFLPLLLSLVDTKICLCSQWWVLTLYGWFGRAKVFGEMLSM